MGTSVKMPTPQDVNSGTATVVTAVDVAEDMGEDTGLAACVQQGEVMTVVSHFVEGGAKRQEDDLENE